MTRLSAIVAAIVVLGLGARVAGAQAVSDAAAQFEEAERLFNQGVVASEAGEYAAAVRVFRTSFELNPIPDALYNIGMCLKADGDASGAANAFRDYMVAVGGRMSAAERAELDALVAELTPQVGRLVVHVDQPHVQLTLDGEPWDLPPSGQWVAVEPGQHVMLARKPGFAPASAVVDVGAGEVVEFSISLEALEAVPGAVPVQTGTAAAPAGPVSASAPPAPTVSPEAAPSHDSTWPWLWLCVGTAGAATAALAVTGALTVKYRDDFVSGGALDADLRDKAVSLRIATDVLLGLAVAAGLGAGIILLVDLGEDDAETPAPATAVALFPVGFTLWW